ncbi:MAG: MptD family putative ECF transporter S component, partial [Ruminococcus sp.]|nr:MptD family putative ECF transporter S component [Ruminococcus sp.]
MAKKEIAASANNNKKLRTKELIYAGAFGALYIVLMLVIVLGTSMIPILYLLAPITVGLVCGTVYMLCVLKVRKFGAALILGVLFAICACSNAWFSFVGALAAALLAELVIKLGKYRSKKMYLLSFVVFNLNMACPYMMLSFARDSFLKRSVEYYGQEYADGIEKIAPT